MQCPDKMLVFPSNTTVSTQSPARSLHCVWLGPPVTLVLLFGVVDLGCGVLGAIESVQVFCSGQKKGQS